MTRESERRSVKGLVLLLCIGLLLCGLCTASLAQADSTKSAQTIGPDLIRNGSFDNGIWYERFRGWTPSYWYEWFTRGGDAPEHAVGKRLPHSGKEYVRIHMLFHAWRGGVLQNVRDVEPGHWYKLTAYGWFAPGPTEDHPEGPPSKARIGIDPCGTLAEQYSVDVSKHPAPKYDEGVGDDPESEESDGPDVEDTTVWSDYHDYYTWGKFEAVAEAKSDVITAILYCAPPQRPESWCVYEMNWDSVTMYEVPWPTKRLADESAVLKVDERLWNMVATAQPTLNTGQVTWRTKVPAGASQVLYRFVDSAEQAGEAPTEIRLADFPFETPVVYERSDTSHWIEIDPLNAPKSAGALEVVALSRALIDGECKTLCSAPKRIELAKR